MIKVLIVAAAIPSRQKVLAEALEELRARGADTQLACHFDLDKLSLDERLAQLKSFADAADGAGHRFRPAVGRAEPARRVWLHAQRDPWLRQHARRADVLVALDQHAVHTVWQLAQRNRHADAVYGLRPCIKAVDRRLENTGRIAWREALKVGPSPRVPLSVLRGWVAGNARALARVATGRRVMRTALGSWLWSRVVSAPAVPSRVRRRLALRVHRSLVEAGQLSAAARASSTAASLVQDPQARADVLAYQADTELRMGRVPQGLEAAISAQLALADRHVAKDPLAAARALGKARMLACDRVLHFDRLSSPLVEDPDRFLAPFRRSTAAQTLAARRGRATPPASPPPDRPLRLLLVTVINDNFLTEIRQRYEDIPGVEVRFLDLDADPSHRWLRGAGSIMAHVLAGHSELGDEVEEWLRPHLDWADTVFVDWCSAAAALFTLLDPGTTRIVVRLHSFEAFTLWPHVVDFSRVSDMVFVSDHLRELATAVLPQLTGDEAPRLWVISNAMDLRRFPRSKPTTARFNLGLVGVGSVAKDPRWALDVLRLLRGEDNRYRLLLIGGGIDAKASAAAKQYHELLLRDLDELEPSGAVRRLGQTDDVPSALTDVGVILSSSVRESFHCALVEGTASGAVPVVRDWPFFAGRPHGARTLFPEEWVVDTPEDAVKRILSTTATDEGWREAGRAAARHALARWDWTVTQRQFDELLLGRR